MEHSEQTYTLLQYVSDNHNCSLLDFMNDDSLPGTNTEKQALIFRLNNLGLVYITGRLGDSMETRHLRITGSGIDLLFRVKEVTPLQRVAAAAEQQADIALSEAKSAQKDAFFSKVVSIISLAIGFAGLVLALLTFLG